ncbi:hypothetical protein [Bacillus pseudomycoides]|uniref:hypothetical protein n=1 Tax=Bacillus pseudomycoides TaxID=64104 RepID=UPI000BF600F3|nr:hypothetical protein [Bacillus pseudomycoides]PGD73703.1 hypothetical protein COM46_21735 [Bacillus pseudomycoides]
MKILVVGQSFGFGPAAEVLNVIHYLENIVPKEQQELEFSYWCNPAMLNLNDKSLLDNNPDESFFQYSMRKKEILDIDLVISSYDPEAVIWSWWNDIPVIYYNGIASLCEMNVPNISLINNLLVDFKELKEENNVDTLLKLLDKISIENFHILVVAAMKLASEMFVRNGPNLKMNGHYPTNTKVISTLIPMIQNPPKTLHLEKPFIYISMSGSIAPVIPFEKNMQFVESALKFFIDLARKPEFSLYNFVFSCNQKIYDNLDKRGLPINFHLLGALKPSESAWMLKNSKIIMASPGYTTIHEAAFFKTPLFFIPEQNGSQPISYYLLKQNGYPCQPSLVTLGETILAREFNEEIENLYEEALKLFKFENQKLTNQFINEVHYYLQNEDLLTQRGIIQHTTIKEIFGGYNGTKDLANGIMSFLNGMNRKVLA